MLAYVKILASFFLLWDQNGGGEGGAARVWTLRGGGLQGGRPKVSYIIVVLTKENIRYVSETLRPLKKKNCMDNLSQNKFVILAEQNLDTFIKFV